MYTIFINRHFQQAWKHGLLWFRAILHHFIISFQRGIFFFYLRRLKSPTTYISGASCANGNDRQTNTATHYFAYQICLLRLLKKSFVLLFPFRDIYVHTAQYIISTKRVLAYLTAIFFLLKDYQDDGWEF